MMATLFFALECPQAKRFGRDGAKRKFVRKSKYRIFALLE